MKTCSKCGVSKNETEFYFAYKKKNKVLRGDCIECHRTIRRIARRKNWCPDKERLRKYGISPPVFKAMKEQQNGACAICKKPDPLCVDHNHSTGHIRGLLCHRCNKALGMMEDNIILLQSACSYLGQAKER